MSLTGCRYNMSLVNWMYLMNIWKAIVRIHLPILALHLLKPSSINMSIWGLPTEHAVSLQFPGMRGNDVI